MIQVLKKLEIQEFRGWMEMLFSVVVSSYKRFEHMKSLLESVRSEFRQGEFELIAVCSDPLNSPKILWLAEQSDVRLIALGDREEGKPRAKSLYVYENLGIEAASGDWILITNDDTVLECGPRDALLSASGDADVIVFPTEIDDSSLGKRAPIIGRVTDGDYESDVPLLDFAAFHRDVFREIGGADENFDWYGRGADMGIRVALSRKFKVATLANGGLKHKLVLEARRPPHPAYDFEYLQIKWRDYQSSNPNVRIDLWGQSPAGGGQTFYTNRIWPVLNEIRLRLKSIYRDTYR